MMSNNNTPPPCDIEVTFEDDLHAIKITSHEGEELTILLTDVGVFRLIKQLQKSIYNYGGNQSR